MIRNDSSLRFQFKRGLKRLRMIAREALAGSQPERRPDISEAAVVDDGDDGVRAGGNVPVASEPDQIISLVVYNRPWLQPPGQAAGCPPENDDAVHKYEDVTSGSSEVEQSLTSRELQKEDKGEVLQCFMEGKRAAWGWRS